MAVPGLVASLVQEHLNLNLFIAGLTVRTNTCRSVKDPRGTLRDLICPTMHLLLSSTALFRRWVSHC